MENLKVVSLNTNGLRLPLKRRALFSNLRKTKADFFLIQETHGTLNDETIWLSEWGGEGVFSHGRSNSRGVGILFNRNLQFSLDTTFKDTDGRFLILQISQGKEQFTLVNIYAPTACNPANQLAVFSNIQRILSGLEIHNLIIGGDLNLQLDLDSDSPYSIQIQSLMEDYDLVDVWKKRNPNSKRGTFHRNTYSSRLDYILAPAHFIPSITTANILPEPLSDHCMVTMEVKVSSDKRGPGFWKFDNTLLSDPIFVQEMKALIQESLQEEMENPTLKWEWLKFKIREFCIAFTIKQRREQKKLINDLEKRLKLLAEHHDLSDSPDTAMESQSIKRELAEIQTNKASKIIFKAKAKWTGLGEKPSAYFLGLEKRLSKDKCISSLKDENGQTLTDPSDILAYECRYFSDIYKENPDVLDPIQDFPLTRDDVPQITASHNQLINLPFTHRDFHTALKDLNKNKSPGSDGITPEFYLAFWDFLHQHYYDNIMFSMDQGTLSHEQRTGIITLIPKKNQDRLFLNNWRPITLLNTDLKIFSKALASRLQMCIRDIVSPDQTGFIKGRSITTNLTNIQMIIDNANVSNSSGLLLAVDYRKAFDTIRWNLVFHALDLFGFGEFIISAIKMLFNNIKTCVLNAGYSSQYFYPSRGIRQGCCCSPSLFVIAVELLAILVRDSVDIRGITIARKQIKVSQYADDATFFVNDFPSLNALLHLLARFALMSGLNINHQKSYLLLLGHHLDPPLEYQHIRIAEQVTILGITFRNDMSEDQNYALNFAPKLDKIQSICSTWLHRSLSMKGKVLIISSLLSSILQYPCSVLPTPIRAVIEFKKIVTGFFWNDKRGKVAYNTLIQNIADGGIRLPDLTTRIQTTHLFWVKYLWNNPDSLMAAFLKDTLAYEDIQSMLRAKTNFAARLPRRHCFLSNILSTWAKLHNTVPKDESQIQHELIWDNDHIRVSSSTVRWSTWKDAGILCINDLLHSTLPRFLSHAELGDKFGIAVSFLDILQIRSAIPPLWKRKLVNAADPNIQPKPTIDTIDGDSISIAGMSTKSLYYALIRFLKPSITSQTKWNVLFPLDAAGANEYWSKAYQSPYKYSRDTKLQAFQFRLLHRFIPCNRFLRNIKIKEDDKCSFCPASDTIQHFLFECPIVVTFWAQIVAWFARETDLHLHVSLRTFLFGLPDTVPNAGVINFILIFTRFYIYRQKLFHQASLHLMQFLRELRLRLHIEKYITAKDNKPFLFTKWQRIYVALG